MIFVSFNVNSIRTRLHQVRAVVERYQPELLGLQETKVTDEAFPREDLEQLGYHCSFFGQKTHYGVALLSRRPPQAVEYGYPGDEPDAQRRFIAAEYEIDGHRLKIVNGYFPQGESRDHPVKFPAKQRFYADLRDYLCNHVGDASDRLLMGDFNVAPEDRDIGIGADNARRWLRTGKCSFLPEERDWLRAVCQCGYTDTYRRRYPEVEDRFSWFDYRSRGFETEPKRGLRIDLILASPTLADKVVDAGIDYDIRAMERPSDHCPVWVDLDLAS